ncbi:hypothetical protein ABZW18_20335 [Streptomyces sp. NPDC004647]|uniref:hypothetical protein n=1 Tax=Streptomyces sp. NPDC004647 TaxID=3154671 RepID=UPI0033A13BE9
MTAPGNDDFERKQNFALQWETSTPRERRAMLREQRNSTDPQTTRRAYVLVGLVFLAGAISGLVKAIARDAPASTIALFAGAIVVCAAMAELSRRGRTRLGFMVLVVAMIGLGLAEALRL